MNKIWLVFRREYITRVKKLSFILTTLAVPLGFAAMMAVMIGIMVYSSEQLRIAVVDEMELFSGNIPSAKDGSMHFDKKRDSLEDVKDNYEEDGYDGILYIPKFNVDRPKGIQYIADESLGLSSKSYIQDKIENEIRKRKLVEMNIDKTAYKNLQKIKVDLEEARIGGGKSDSKTGGIVSTGIATAVGYSMGMLMYMVIFIYGSMIMYSVMEEKTSRIVEVILSSVRPFKLMIGKILGMGAVGVTQFIIWIVFIFLIQLVAGIIIGGTVDMPTTSGAMGGAAVEDVENMMSTWEEIRENFHQLPIKTLIFSLLFYFLGGYLLYGAMFAAVGSAINDPREAQGLTLPIAIPVILALFIMIATIEKPNSALAVWSSLIPFFSPILMPARIPFGVPFWQLGLSMLFLALGTIAMIWLAARIYRVGILMYGKKPSLKELGKWMLYKG